MECVFFLINKIKNNKNENVKKFTNVKLYGAKLNIVIAPNKKGATNKNFTKCRELRIIGVDNDIMLENWKKRSGC